MSSSTNPPKKRLKSVFSSTPEPSPDSAPHHRLVAHVKPVTTLRAGMTATSGLGLFASPAGLSAGSSLASISASFVMSVPRSAQSPVGVAVSSILSPPPPGEFVLWLDMAKGRREHLHPCHPYLASLPDEMADVPSWSPSERLGLKGTNLGKGSDDSSAELEEMIARYLPPLLNATGEYRGMFEGLRGGDGIRWAKACYRSRRFPGSLLQKTGEGKYGSAKDGILLPFLDIMNHRMGAKMTWEAIDEGGLITFVAGEDVAPNSEVFNNYGGKANEELMMCYGFAIQNNAEDCYRLKLVVGGGEDGPTDLGTFDIYRADTNGRHEQFPRELWKALASLYVEEEEGVEGEEGGDDEQLEIGIEEVELLLATLTSRLRPFDATREADEVAEKGELGETHKESAIAMYRCGQGDVLRQSVRTLEGYRQNEVYNE
ncbi:hypothetical protein TrRE_jg10676 [Triparma retinervis]|uniref:SET domain-containing protein n=1 Tax=Triparma retinervis TaxID=2557542 RepID=A0A9W7A1W6_9STRA|nr:hypothetical protein TrRE_jg10676 [Triparma retinervis]